MRRKEDAWQLLCLVDSIHEWAKTTYRPFIERRLKIWNEAVERDFLLEWDVETTRDDTMEVRKRYEQERGEIEQFQRGDDIHDALFVNPYFHEPDDVRLPVWANSLDVQTRRNLGSKGWLLLVEAWEVSGQLYATGDTISWAKTCMGRKHILEMSVTPKTDQMSICY